jgi:hypothetical protein
MSHSRGTVVHHAYRIDSDSYTESDSESDYGVPNPPVTDSEEDEEEKQPQQLDLTWLNKIFKDILFFQVGREKWYAVHILYQKRPLAGVPCGAQGAIMMDKDYTFYNPQYWLSGEYNRTRGSFYFCANCYDRFTKCLKSGNLEQGQRKIKMKCSVDVFVKRTKGRSYWSWNTGRQYIPPKNVYRKCRKKGNVLGIPFCTFHYKRMAKEMLPYFHQDTIGLIVFYMSE